MGTSFLVAPSRTTRGPDLAVLEGSRPRSGPQARNRRRILGVAPANTRSFGTFHRAFPLTGARSMMPPQGLLRIAAYLPEAWEVRFLDENLRPAGDADSAWADAGFWRLAGPALRRGRIEEVLHVGLIAHHLIRFARDCAGGDSSFLTVVSGETASSPSAARA